MRYNNCSPRTWQNAGGIAPGPSGRTMRQSARAPVRLTRTAPAATALISLSSFTHSFMAIAAVFNEGNLRRRLIFICLYLLYTRTYLYIYTSVSSYRTLYDVQRTRRTISLGYYNLSMCSIVIAHILKKFDRFVPILH